MLQVVAFYAVRLIGVDTPETTHPTVGVEPFGPAAFAYTTARLTGATVRLDLDPAGDAIDTAGRWLRYAMLRGGEHVNATLIRERYAMAIRTFLYARRQEFLGLEAQARRAWRGRWAVTDRGGVHAAPWLSGMGAAWKRTRARTHGPPDGFTSQESTHNRTRYQSGRKTQHQGKQKP